MYGLPKDFDGSMLVGRVLEMVCFNKNQVYLHFDGKTSIMIESAFSYDSDQILELPIKESSIMVLLEASVLEAKGDNNGTLSLVFSNGQTVKVYDTSKKYESYSINYGGKVIIV
jgi:hypothetical protein